MEKKYHFLAGFPRTGNTVLSALLNQHPDIYSSPLNPLCEFMWSIHSNNKDMIKSDVYPERKHMLMSSMIKNYYSDVNKPVILDREKNWGHPANMEMIKIYITEKPKIIFTIRPIAEILASLIHINKNNILTDMINHSWGLDKNLSEYDNMCNFLMHENHSIANIFNASKSIIDPSNKDVFHIVRYNDLLSSPQDTMNKIYNFLEVDFVGNDFNNISQNEKYGDTLIGLPENLHVIRSKISKGNVDTKKYVSEYVKKRYAYVDEFFDSLNLS